MPPRVDVGPSCAGSQYWIQGLVRFREEGPLPRGTFTRGARMLSHGSGMSFMPCQGLSGDTYKVTALVMCLQTRLSYHDEWR